MHIKLSWYNKYIEIYIRWNPRSAVFASWDIDFYLEIIILFLLVYYLTFCIPLIASKEILRKLWSRKIDLNHMIK